MTPISYRHSEIRPLISDHHRCGEMSPLGPQTDTSVPTLKADNGYRLLNFPSASLNRVPYLPAYATHVATATRQIEGLSLNATAVLNRSDVWRTNAARLPGRRQNVRLATLVTDCSWDSF